MNPLNIALSTIMSRRVGPIHSQSLTSHLHDENSFDIVGRNVTFFRGSKQILDSHNWRFQSHQISAILGPSGCGKSTLLNILLGRIKKGITGFVGVSKKEEKSSLPMRVSFVGQNDHLSHFLTVHESLMLASHLKNPSASELRHRDNAERAMQLLSLIPSSSTKIGRLSGGQKRRLSIALELLGNPSMLILDEPTTGLDSGATQQLVISLQKLLVEAKNKGHGMAIIATIHQPSARVFAQFQHIHVMSKHGRALFSNSPDKLLKSLSAVSLECPTFHNPADYICELAAGEYGQAAIDELCDLTSRERMLVSGAGRRQLTIEWPEESFWSQVNHLSKVIICSDLRQPFLLFVRLLEPSMIALNNGLVFGTVGETSGCVPTVKALYETDPSVLFQTQDDQRWDVYQNTANLFFGVLNQYFVGLTPVLLFFPRELAIVAKQHTNGWHSVRAYFLTKIIVELLFLSFAVASYQSIWYVITKQPLEWQRIAGLSMVFAGFHMFGFLQGIIISGIFASSALKSVYMGVLSMLPFILMSGFVVRTQRIPEWIRPASLISYYRFGYELLLLILYGNGRCESLLPVGGDDLPVISGRHNSTGMRLKAPRWTSLVKFTDPEAANMDDYQLGEWLVGQWFQRKDRREQSWILDEHSLSSSTGSHGAIIGQHCAIFGALMIVWLAAAYLIMRHRMSRPAV